MIKGSITAKPQAFAAAVKWAAKFVTTKPSVPIQAGILLEAGGGQLTVTAYNENVTGSATLPVDGDGAGRAVVSGRLLAALVGTFPDKPVEISGDSGALAVATGRWHGTLPVMEEKDFPAMPAAPGPIGEVPGAGFAAAIGRAAVAASEDTSKQIALCGIHLTFGEDSVTAVATDSYRAARTAAPFRPSADLGGPVAALVLASTMTDAAEAFDGPDDIEIGWDPHSLSFRSPTRFVVLRQLGKEAEYGAGTVSALFDRAAALPERVSFQVAELTAPLKRAAAMREKAGTINVAFTENLITLSAKSDEDKRDSGEEIDAGYTGPDHALAFNPGYFGDALVSAPGETVQMTMTTERVTGVLLTAPSDDTWQHVLMPVRVR